MTRKLLEVFCELHFLCARCYCLFTHLFCVLQFTFLQDDIGIPLNYRHMEGFGVHTFTLINKEGKITYVKFHWKPTCGVKNLLEEEAVHVGGSNHSHATQVSHS